MKNKEQLTTVELMDMVAMNLREMNAVEITNKNLPNLINRAKATSMGVKAALQLAIYEAKTKVNERGERSVKRLSGKVKKGNIKLIK